MLPQVDRALGIAISRVQLSAMQHLQVGRLRVNEELVDGWDFEVADQSQVDAHPHAREQVHGLFARDGLRCAENPVSAADAIVQIFLALANQVIARFALVIDQHGHHIADLFDQLGFGPPQRD